jgi:hypothetical protein
MSENIKSSQQSQGFYTFSENVKTPIRVKKAVIPVRISKKPYFSSKNNKKMKIHRRKYKTAPHREKISTPLLLLPLLFVHLRCLMALREQDKFLL